VFEPPKAHRVVWQQWQRSTFARLRSSARSPTDSAQRWAPSEHQRTDENAAPSRQAGGHWFEPSTAPSPSKMRRSAPGIFDGSSDLRVRLWGGAGEAGTAGELFTYGSCRVGTFEELSRPGLDRTTRRWSGVRHKKSPMAGGRRRCARWRGCRRHRRCWPNVGGCGFPRGEAEARDPVSRLYRAYRRRANAARSEASNRPVPPQRDPRDPHCRRPEWAARPSRRARAARAAGAGRRGGSCGAARSYGRCRSNRAGRTSGTSRASGCDRPSRPGRASGRHRPRRTARPSGSHRASRAGRPRRTGRPRRAGRPARTRGGYRAAGTARTSRPARNSGRRTSRDGNHDYSGQPA
jgi:hypothetical protein